MGSEEAFERVATARERIAVDDAHVLALVDLAVENCLERRAHKCIDIGRLANFASSHGHRARQVHAPREQQPAEENHCRGLNNPHHFALIHGVEVVHLHAYVACRTGTVEDVHFHVFRVQQRTGRLLRAHAEIGFRHLRQSCQTRLPGRFVVLQFKLEVAGQRLVAQGRHENCFRLVGRIGHHGVGQLVDVAEKPRFQQRGFHVFALERSHVFLAELSKFLLAVGLHFHAEHFSPLAANHRCHLATHGRGEAHFGAILVDEKCIAGLDFIAFAHDQLRRNAREIVGNEGIFLAPADTGFPLRSLARKLNVQAFAQFNYVCHKYLFFYNRSKFCAIFSNRLQSYTFFLYLRRKFDEI